MIIACRGKGSAPRRSGYSRLSQNELAMELYRLGLFEPGREQQALGCLSLMEFDGKDTALSRVGATLRLQEKLEELGRWKQLAVALARRYRPDLALGLTGEELPPAPPMEEAEAAPDEGPAPEDGAPAALPGEPEAVTAARAQTAEEALP